MRALEGDEGVGSNGDLQPEFEGVFAPAPTDATLSDLLPARSHADGIGSPGEGESAA